MAFKFYLNGVNIGLQETYQGEIAALGNHSYDDMNSIMISQTGLTISQFNELTNSTLKHDLVKTFFSSSLYLKGMTFSKDSIRYGTTKKGTDGPTLQEGVGVDDNGQVTCILVNQEELPIGWVILRICSSVPGYDISTYAYSDLVLHYAGWGTDTVSGLPSIANTYQWRGRFLNLAHNANTNAAIGIHVATSLYKVVWGGATNSSETIYNRTRYSRVAIDYVHIADSSATKQDLILNRHIHITVCNPSSAGFEIGIGFNSSSVSSAVVRLVMSGSYWGITTDQAGANKVYPYTSDVLIQPFSFIEFVRDDIENAVYFKINGSKIYIKKNATGQPNLTDSEFTARITANWSGVNAKDFVYRQTTVTKVHIYDLNFWRKAIQGKDAEQLTAWGMREAQVRI